MPRTREIVRGLVKLGFDITFIPLQDNEFDPGTLHYLPRGVNILASRDQPLEAFVDHTGRPFSRLFVSRPHNMAVLMEILQRKPKFLAGAEVIYDAEALFARREMLKTEVTGLQSSIDSNELLRTELAFARAADRVTTVSRLEEREFRKAGVPDVDVLGYPVDLDPTQRPFKARQDFLFVGRMEEEDSPNVDSVVWFVNEVLPLIDKLTTSMPRVVLVGRTKATRVKALQNPRVIIVGEMRMCVPGMRIAACSLPPRGSRQGCRSRFAMRRRSAFPSSAPI